MVKEALLDHIPIPKKNIYPIPVTGKPAAAAANYATTLRQFFGNKKPVFDWMLLGLGPDGHTASLFPGTSVLKENKKWISEVWLASKQTWRISFTYPLINQASQIIFLVDGKEKAPVVKAILKKTTASHQLPASKVNPLSSLWLLTTEAASLL
jgi:6-phosphogluconolactonase